MTKKRHKSFPAVRGVYMRKYLKYGIAIGIIMGTFLWILNLFIPVDGLWVTLGIVTNPITNQLNTNQLKKLSAKHEIS